MRQPAPRAQTATTANRVTRPASRPLASMDTPQSLFPKRRGLAPDAPVVCLERAGIGGGNTRGREFGQAEFASGPEGSSGWAVLPPGCSGGSRRPRQDRRRRGARIVLTGVHAEIVEPESFRNSVENVPLRDLIAGGVLRRPRPHDR